VNGRRISVEDDGQLRRRRLAALFRALLAFPHYVVLSVWTFIVAFVLPVSWVVALFAGRVPQRLHGHLGSYLRYAGQVTAWIDLLSGRYPSVRHAYRHPFKVEVPPPERQRRLVTLFRLLLAVPAIILSSVFGVILTTVAFAAWWVALVLGRNTAGLQELGTFCLRYQLETLAYLFLLTEAYPKLAPAPTPKQIAIPGLE
jgi:Domain of unknown function (DUF4389)